jgi:hypothetical protein
MMCDAFIKKIKKIEVDILDNGNMSDLKNTLYRATEAILVKLLDFKKSNPDFTFALRERDSVQSDEVRLASGQWFQGSNYIYVPLFGKGDTARKIKTLGFVLTFEEDGEISENYVEISFKGGITDPKELAFHNELAARLNINLNNGRFGSFYYEDPEKYLSNLDDYINRVRSIALELLDKNNIRSQYLIPEDIFVKRLSKINEIRSSLRSSSGVNLHIGSLNTILYGPPGTGKTYNSIDRAVQIAKPDQYTGEHTANKKLFDLLRKKGQIEFVTFHQNYTYEDFISGIKPDVTSTELRFKNQPGVFYKICQEARLNYEASKSEDSFRPIEEDIKEMLEKITEDHPLEFKTVTGKPFWLFDYSDNTIYLRKSNNSEKHTLSISTIIEISQFGREMISGLSAYYGPIIEYLKKNRRRTASKTDLKNYVIVIDEINRANISKVFGELITLIEDDKRIGRSNELRVRLPNGDPDFGVPPNLYIIGTMNTADKSIALIDIALRRRFEFEGMYPDARAIKDDKKSALLVQINQAIYGQKKSADYLIGHAYFMNDSSIPDILKKKVIPLLMEYFSGKMNLVIDCFKATDWEITYNASTFTWDVKPSIK